MNSETIRIGCIPTIIPNGILEENSFSVSHIDPKNWENALVEGEVDAVLFPLWQLPIVLDDRLTIGALTKRLKTNVCLVKVAAQKGNENLSSLPAGFKVFSPSEIYINQLKSIRSDLKVNDAESADYWLLPHFEIGLQNLFNKEHIIFAFQFSELVPLPGSGVWAYVVLKKRMDIRRWLAAIHHSATSRITNIERGVLKNFQEKAIAIYGLEDDNGYLHFSAFKASNQRPITYSSSTSHGMVPKLVELLNQ